LIGASALRAYRDGSATQCSLFPPAKSYELWDVAADHPRPGVQFKRNVLGGGSIKLSITRVPNSVIDAELDTTLQISRFTKLKLTSCAPISSLSGIGFFCAQVGRPDLRPGDRTRFLFASGSIEMSWWISRSERAALALQAPHGCAALVAALHCLQIVFSIRQRFGGMHFCLVVRDANQMSSTQVGLFFSCY
jgi:hypothetical protein